MSGSELFTRKQPQIIDGNTYSDSPRPLEATSKRLPIAFGIQTINAEMDSKFCNYTYSVLDENGTQTSYRPMERCVTENFDTKARIVRNSNMSEFWCLPQTPEFTAQPNIQISALCPMQEGREEFFSKTPLAVVIYSKNGLTLYDYNNPLQLYADYDYIPLAANNTVLSSWSLTHLNITTDDGWLVSNKKLDQYIQVKNEFNRNVQNTVAPGVIYTFAVSKQETYYLRSYIRLQGVLADIGGFASFIFPILSFIVMPFAKVKLSEAFINEFFEVKRMKPNKKKESSKQIISKEPNKVKDQIAANTVKSTKQNTLQGVQMQTRGNLQLLKTENITIERELNQKRKAREEFDKSPHQSENQSLLLQRRQEDQTPTVQKPKANKDTSLERPKIYHKRAHTDPVQLESCSQLENSERNDKNNLGNEDNSVIGLRDVMWRFESLKKSATNVKSTDQTSKSQDLESLEVSIKKKESCAEENDLHYQNKIDIKIEKQPSEISQTALSKQNSHKSPKQFTISLFEYCWSFVSRSESLKGKMVILNQGIKIFDERLDIFNLVKKLRDIDKIKGLLFDKDQLFLFERTQRPEIMSRNRHWHEEEYLHYDEISNENQEQIIAVKQRVQDKPEMSLVDLKLLDLYNEDIYIKESDML